MIQDPNLVFLELFGNRVEDNKDQDDTYRYLEKKLIVKSDDTNLSELSIPLQSLNTMSQMSNIVYPSIDDNKEKSIGKEGLEGCFNILHKGNKIEYSYKEEILKKYNGAPFDIDMIGQFSSKIKSILQIIKSTKGIVFIYSNWISSGVIPLVLALEQNGYKKY